MPVLEKRSTVYLDPALHKALRLKALETSKSMSELINDAVRASLAGGAGDLAAGELRDAGPETGYGELKPGSLAGKRRLRRTRSPVSIRIICWQDGQFWLGYAEQYPDYMTQGLTLDELKANLKDIYQDLSSGKIPCARREEELVLA